ncbi:VOC family protein [Streptosporangium sandarakinum]
MALVLTVEDVEEAVLMAVQHGGTVIVPWTSRPEWGPGCPTAHLRDPDGDLVELQSPTDVPPSARSGIVGAAFRDAAAERVPHVLAGGT